jgi:hypothetical protein
VSKRSLRSLAVVAGAALAFGSMAPAMAARLDVIGGAAVEVDPTAIVTSLPVALPTLPALPSYTQLNGTLLGLGALGLGGGTLLTGTALGGVQGIVGTALLGLGGLGGDCGLVAALSCNTGSPVTIPVNVLSDGAIGDIAAPVSVDVENILNGGLGLPGLPGLPGFPGLPALPGLDLLGSILDGDANVNIVAAVVAAL